MTSARQLDDPVRVLLVDDTPDLCELMKLALERTGDFKVVAVAGNGLEGIELASSHSPDLVLLDISMPVMDGLEALPVLRQVCPRAKVVMLSGFGPQEMARITADRGAHGYLQKGRPMRDLLGELHRVIAGSEVPDEG
ncbi:MAG: ATP-binding region, ATPase domain protein [Marmoricola sp.]|jgi:DNA-binding NarL/FixJ family response regulator|nr:ATP-binding region, ATPase domain protein [Marmoricola sp.]